MLTAEPGEGVVPPKVIDLCIHSEAFLYVTFCLDFYCLFFINLFQLQTFYVAHQSLYVCANLISVMCAPILF